MKSFKVLLVAIIAAATVSAVTFAGDKANPYMDDINNPKLEALNKFRADQAERIKKEQQASAAVNFEGKSYQPDEVTRDFMNVAFSDAVWNQDQEAYPYLFLSMAQPYRKETHRKFLEAIKKDHPWLAPYLLNDSLPRSNVINKWVGEITIGIDWPQGMQGIGSLSDNLEHAYPAIQKNIESLIPTVTEITGIPARFISPEDPVEKTAGFAKIRIIPIKTTAIFKTPREFEIVPHQGWLKEDFEYALAGAVPYTAESKIGVDGYLLPLPNNEIGMVVCKVNPDVEAEIFSSLITECLLRSLGLPEISEVNSSKLSSANVEKVSSQKITAYDALIAKLLYCDEIKPGMDKNSAFLTLVKGACFEKIKGASNGN